MQISSPSWPAAPCLSRDPSASPRLAHARPLSSPYLSSSPLVASETFLFYIRQKQAMTHNLLLNPYPAKGKNTKSKEGGERKL